MRRAVTAILGAVLLVLSAAALLLAVDVLRFESRVAGDDVRFREAAAARGLWRAPELFPWAAARALLGVDDDLEYRRALRTFRLGRPHESSYRQQRLLGIRARAQEQLEKIVDSHADPKRRAAAANLIGALDFINADQVAPRPVLFRAAADAFRAAVTLDPANEDAKYNLELAVSHLHAAQVFGGKNDSSTTPSGNGGKGAGAGSPGTGY